jgi:hypothetical protein
MLADLDSVGIPTKPSDSLRGSMKADRLKDLSVIIGRYNAASYVERRVLNLVHFLDELELVL